MTTSKGREGKRREERNSQTDTTTESYQAPARAPENAGAGGGLSPGNSAAAEVYARVEGLLNAAVPLPFAPIRGWLEAGHSADDIVESIREVTERQRAKDPEWRPGSLVYFDQAIKRGHRDRVSAAASLPFADRPKGTPEARKKLLETQAKVLNDGYPLDYLKAEDVAEMLAHGFITPETVKRMGLPA